MRIEIRHRVLFRYDAPVALGPHLLRLTPRGGAGMRHGFRIQPAPALRLDDSDVDGNRVTRLDFTGNHAALEIEARVAVETAELRPAVGGDPARYLAVGPAEAGGQSGGGEAGAVLERTAARLSGLAAADPALFASRLAVILAETLRHEPHDSAPPRPPGDTLRRGVGSARDIATLYVALSRRAGVPARLVAGYWLASAAPAADRGAHVWAEVLLPDGLWLGLDPVQGGPTGPGHVPVAAGVAFTDTLPVAPSLYGVPVRRSMRFELAIATPG